MVRVSLDQINLCLMENEQQAILLQTSDMRLAFCNSHLGSNSENIVFKLPIMHLGHYLKQANKPNTWLKCGGVDLNEVNY